MAAPAFRFRLYVAGDGPHSRQAIANLNDLCRRDLPPGSEVEIVDVIKTPGRALEDGVYLTPTLIKMKPAPTLRIVGNLSQPEPLLRALGREGKAA